MPLLKRIGTWKHELQDEDLEAIEFVTQWLKSSSQPPSNVYDEAPNAVLDPHHLPWITDSLAESLCLLPNNTPDALSRGLLKCHQNLVITMGNLMCHHIILGPHVCLASYYDTHSLTSLLVLDPRYNIWPSHRLWDELDMHSHLEATKQHLHAHFLPSTTNYSWPHSACSIDLCGEQLSSEGWFHISLLKPSSDIHGWGSRVLQAPSWEIWHLWSIAMWAGHHSQFPNLSCFAGIFFQFLVSSQLISSCYSSLILITFLLYSMQDLLCCRTYFFRRHDTISLHHASLNPETIWTLMLVKQWLHLACTAIHDILGD